MNTNTKILYALIAAFGLSSTAVNMAIADADIDKGYEPVAKTEPLPVYQKAPVYNVPEVKPQPVIQPQPVIVSQQMEVKPIECKEPACMPVVEVQTQPCNTCPPVVPTVTCQEPACQEQPRPLFFAHSAQPQPVVVSNVVPAPEPLPQPDRLISRHDGPCNMCEEMSTKIPGTCNVCAQHQAYVQPQVALVNYVPTHPEVTQAMQRNCCQMAPIALEHVDFRLKNAGEDLYNSKLGNYRFRIFGCRRYNKEAHLNNGRILEKNIKFNQVFEDTVGDCYKVMPMPKDLCLQTVPAELPEYILTAEITDYFMNVCDEYDWDKAEKADARTGSSEITVTWRLMDLSKNKVYWKGETSGYGDLFVGEANGELRLIERAFADAASNLQAMTGFEDQLLQRISPADMDAQRRMLIEEERALNPLKCGYAKEYEGVKNCELSRPGAVLSQCCPCSACQPIVETGGVVETHEVINSCIDENGQIKADSQCHVVDDVWVDTGDVKSLDNLCVVATDPCKALTPENIYRMRSSVVQIDSPNGRKGAGLLISDRFILTSGDLVDHNNNTYKVTTIKNSVLSARAVRVNPSKNTALLMLDQSTDYTPLALNLSLPEVGRNGFLTLGILDVNNFKNEQDYLENSAKIEGYRYSEEKGAEILANTFIQNVTVGGALFYKDCTVSGMAHSGIKTDNGLDVFVPTETALRSLGISICGHEYVEESPWQQTIYKPVSEQITIVQQAPEAMNPKDRK